MFFLSESILTYWPNQGGLFGGEAAGKKVQQTEVMEKSKEELMEELMAKLKEDLAKGRRQVAAKEDTVDNVVKEEGAVKEGVAAEMKGFGDMSEEELVFENLVEEHKQVAAKEDIVKDEVKDERPDKAEMKDEHHFDEMSVKEEVTVENVLVGEILKGESLVKEEKAQMKGGHGFEDIFETEEVTIENILVEEVEEVKRNPSARGKGLHKEKDEISEESKKADKVKTYPCKEPGCGKRFGRLVYLSTGVKKCP